jgi:hypothetical protein
MARRAIAIKDFVVAGGLKSEKVLPRPHYPAVHMPAPAQQAKAPLTVRQSLF